MDPETPEDAFELDCSARSLHGQRLASLGVVATHVAHDFRALLIPIAGFARALRTQVGADPLAQQRATEIVRAAELGRELVQQILTFAYGQPREPRALSLGRAVHDALPLLRAVVDAHVEVRVAVDPRTPPVIADGVDILRVLLNLVLNAAQAVRPPLGVIEIGVVGAQDAAASRWVRLTVADNGVGMSQAQLLQVIESFSVLETTPRAGGLGLTIVHRLIEAHGGRMRIESEAGVGTTVRIDLPEAAESQ